MSNMYGYNDYDGPKDILHSTTLTQENPNPSDVSATTGNCSSKNDGADSDDDNNDNPLQVGFWMEGDSMAPPCGTSISTIHAILQYLQVTKNDIIYDLGCGDGRFCLEAYYHYHCTTYGIEIEADLVSRAQLLITNILQQEHQAQRNKTLPPTICCMDLRQIFKIWMEDTPSDPITTTDTTTLQCETEFPLPTIILLYLLPESLLEIESLLIQLLLRTTISPSQQQSCRIVCNTWGIPHWKPIQVTTISEHSAPGVSTNIYVYTKDSFEHAK